MSSDLWSFAQLFYARPGVEAACLRLQTGGTDVCLLLCAAWLGQRGVACTAERIQQLSELAQPWQSAVITPLRQLRQSWRAAAATDSELAQLRERVKAVELEAERELLLRLETVAQAWPRDATDEALLAWLETLARTAGENDRDALQELRVAASLA